MDVWGRKISELADKIRPFYAGCNGGKHHCEHADRTVDDLLVFGKRACFALILLPWVTSYMASTFVYTLLYDYSYSVFNFIFADMIGIIPRQNWLGDLNTVMGTVMNVSVWHFLPFSILVLTNAIKQR